MRLTKIIQTTVCLSLALLVAALLWIGALLPRSSDESLGTLIGRDWQGLGAFLELHGLGNKADGATQMVLLDPKAQSTPGRAAANYIVLHSSSLNDRLIEATVLADQQHLDTRSAEQVVSQLVTSRRFDLMPQTVQLLTGLPLEVRAPIADALDAPFSIAADAGNWQQVLTWALQIDPTAQVKDDMASRLNNMAVALPPGSQALSLLAEAKSLNPSDPLIGANWASDSAQLDIAAGVTSNFSTYIALLQQGLAKNSGPSNYSQVIAEMNSFQYTPFGWMW